MLGKHCDAVGAAAELLGSEMRRLGVLRNLTMTATGARAELRIVLPTTVN